jgi:broad-specificity NMP kinase
MIVAISGTPGTGKSHIARKLRKTFTVLDLNKIIRDKKLYDSYDRASKTYDVDIDKLGSLISKITKGFEYDRDDAHQVSMHDVLRKMKDNSMSLKDFLKRLDKYSHIKGFKDRNLLMDNHLSHYVKADFCIIARCGLKTLKKRLESRGYSKKKIEDNMQSEIFEICLQEAKGMKHTIITVNNP